MNTYTLFRPFFLRGKGLAVCILAVLPWLAPDFPQAAETHKHKTSAAKPGKPQNQPAPQPRNASPASDDFIDSGVLEGNELMEGNLEISGLMSDETVTKFGHDFFDAFHRAWRPVEGARYNIIIGERVDPLRGSLINLRLDQNVIFEGFIVPRPDEIKELATALAKEVNNLVRNRQSLESEPEY